jgi:hypothetical protein
MNVDNLRRDSIQYSAYKDALVALSKLEPRSETEYVSLFLPCVILGTSR